MDLTDGPRVTELREELRAYFAGLLTPEERHEILETGLGTGVYRAKVVERLGRDGWLGIGWPVEYGGRGRPVEEQHVFFEELARAGIPFPNYVNTVGPTLIARGSPQQRERFLPGILRGELMFSIGYTEPEAGTDLAALRTRAVRDGDEWVIDGAKVFTSWANMTDYIWLACRTDPDAPRHKGISVFMVPTSAPGFSATLMDLMTDHPTCATYYDGVRVPHGLLVGEVNGGWELMTTLLRRERVAIAASGGRTVDQWNRTLAWCRETGRLDLPWVRAELARARAGVEAMRLLNARLAGGLARDELSAADAAVVKIFGSETALRVSAGLQRAAGPAGRLRRGEPRAAVGGLLESAVRNGLPETFGGGSNGVLRDAVATQALGLPRPSRRA